MSWLQNRLSLYWNNYIKLSYQLSVQFYPIPQKTMPACSKKMLQILEYQLVKHLDQRVLLQP